MRILWGIPLVLAVLVGCAPPATVTRTDGRLFEGRITGGDTQHVFVAGEPVARQDIRDIDHPGNVQAAVGTGMALAFGIGSGAALAQVIDRGTGDVRGLVLGCSTGMFLLSAAMGTWGWVVWTRSVEAAESPPTTSVSVLPTALADGTDTAAGATLVLRW